MESILSILAENLRGSKNEVQKEKSILPFLSETLRGSENVRGKI